MVAVGNIKKITKAMKMVASAKLKKCEEALNVSRNFARGITELWPEEQAKELQKAAKKEGADASAVPTNTYLVVPLTPDRGLCGSVSGQVNRATKAKVNALVKDGKDVKLLTVGEKVRASLERAFNKHFVATVTDHSKLKRRTFRQTSDIASLILAQQFENAELMYNQFKNLISFETTAVPLLSLQQAVTDNKAFEIYETEGNPDIMQNLYEYALACRLNSYLAETDMVEFSQRVNSMGNSSKSAEDMLSRLKLLYNRSRQAKITTELVEIISGASAADDQKKDK